MPSDEVPSDHPHPDRVFTLTHPSGLELSLWEWGATALSLWVPTAAGRRQVLLRHDKLSDYQSAGGFVGGVIGRFANRIAHSKFTLNKQTYALSANEGSHQLHGGRNGFHTKRWSGHQIDGQQARFSLTSPAGDEGYPGTLQVEVTYSLTERGVQIDFCATSDQATIFSPTSHAYFNLDGPAAVTSHGIAAHQLQLFADTYTPVDPQLIPTGQLLPVTGALDFRGPKKLDGLPALDHNFVIRGSGVRPAAVLTSGDQTLRLTVLSDRPGLQVYTGEQLAGVGNTNAKPWADRCAIALETQAYPDAPNQPAFPSAALQSGERFESHTRWEFSRP